MMTEADSLRRPIGRFLPIVLIAVGALLRAAVLYQMSGRLADDRDDYLTVARQYLAHGFWSRFEGYPSAFRPPLYPLVLAALLKCGGGSMAIGLLQLALGTATIALSYVVGKRLGLGAFANVAVLLVALDPLLIAYTVFPMTETLDTFLVILLIAVTIPIGHVAGGAAPNNLPVVASGRCETRCLGRLVSKAAIVGIVFGLCALCRPSIWPTAGLVVLWSVGRWWKERKAAARLHANVRFGRDLLLTGAVAAIFTALVIAPWTIRNWKILGSPIATTTHGGYTLLLGNNHDFFQRVASRPWSDLWSDSAPDRFQQPWIQGVIAEMEGEIGVGADEIARDRWMYRRAFQSIRAEPRLFVRACLVRFLRFWNIVPLPPSRVSLPSAAVWAVGICYALEMGLFPLGMGSLVCRWDSRWTFVGLIIVNFTVVHLFYWTNARMRAPIVPLIALVAARGLMLLAARRKPNKTVAEVQPVHQP
jgi:hypothetical protein